MEPNDTIVDGREEGEGAWRKKLDVGCIDAYLTSSASIGRIGKSILQGASKKNYF